MSTLESFAIQVPTGMTVTNKIECIKAIRALANLSLKEAKDACERYGEQTFYFYTTIPETEIENQFRILRVNGMIIDGSAHVILNELRQLAIKAMQMHEDELSNEITQLILAEKLRRKTNGQLP